MIRYTVVALVMVVMSLPAQAEWLSRTDDGTMGTRIVVELWADQPADGERAIDAVMAEMRRIDAAMSTYKPDSEISRVNAGAARAPVKISAELFELLSTALEYSRITDGAFDITYASVGFMYDFRARHRPDERQIAGALPAVNYHHLLLERTTHTVRFSQPGVRIDLGGIAKGYAVDRGIAILRSHGIAHALVSAGGDSRIIGDRFGKPWIVGIRHPDRKDEVIARLPLVDTAISTSGDYERYFDENGVRYHHIIDPRTGHSASAVRSATILAPTAIRTDGLSKTAFVLGAEAALRIYERLGDVDAILVKPDGKVLYTQGLEPPPAQKLTVDLRGYSSRASAGTAPAAATSVEASGSGAVATAQPATNIGGLRRTPLPETQGGADRPTRSALPASEGANSANPEAATPASGGRAAVEVTKTVPVSPPSAPTPSPGAGKAVAAFSGTADVNWGWPYRGNIVGRFSDSGSDSKGIDIAGKEGDPVLAAADGEVVYAGSGLLRYGNLLIIKHNDRFLSAYAHNRALLVGEKARVSKGQKIAELGSSGIDKNILHFEIRVDGKPSDPMMYLPALK